MARAWAVLVTLAVLGGAFALLGTPEPHQTPVVYVDALGGCQGNTPCEATITAGIARVDPNGTVFVYGFNGSYVESVVIPKPLTLRGEGRDLVRIDGNFSASVIDVGALNVTVESFTLVQASVGVLVDKVARVTLGDLSITRVATGASIRGASDISLSGSLMVNVDGPAVEVLGSDTVTLDGLTSMGSSTGVFARGSLDLVLSDSSILDSGGTGVEVQSSQNVRIGGGGNNVSDGGGRGIWVNDSREVTVRDNEIRGNRLTGLNVSASVNVTVEDNVIEGNGIGAPSPFAAGPSPRPLQGGGGGLWFWLTDPVLVRGNAVRGNGIFGMEIGGSLSTDYTIVGNAFEGNDGPGVILTQGASRIDFASNVRGNRGHGVAMDNVTAVVVHDSAVEGNADFGVRGQSGVNVAVRDSRIAGNGVTVPFGTRGAGAAPTPLQGGGGGLWFWLTDPSEIRGNDIVDNLGPGVTLMETADFDVVDNVIEGNAGAGVLLIRVNSSVVAGNRIAAGGSPGADVQDSTFVLLERNAFEDLEVGVRIRGGCDIRLRGNTFADVDTPLQVEGIPCNVLVEDLASLRFMPRTLNLRSHGQWVTLRFEVSGLDSQTFDLGSVTFEVNGVVLAPPANSPSVVTVRKDGTIEAMVKLDRAEAIAAFGTAGDYLVTASGELANGIRWVASDTVTAILP